MLDIQFIRDNAKQVAENAKQKGIPIDVEKLLKIFKEVVGEETIINDLRKKRNELTHEAKGAKPSQSNINEGKKLREKISELEKGLSKKVQEYNNLRAEVPNIFPDDTPLGGEEANKPEKHWGEASKEKVVDHQTWGEQRGLIDFERGAKVAGNKFYFLKGSLVELELAVFQFAMQLAIKHGFTPMTVPHMVNAKTLDGTGFAPRGEEQQIYKIENEDLNLIATSEIPITGYHAGEILSEKDLPILYAGLSPAYRMEGGAYGKYNRGLYRTHQFNKLELYVFCKPEDSEQWHKKLIEIEEELCQALEIPYQVVRIAAGDLGAPAYKKYDIEYWSPTDQAYRELMSCSNVTDYQARRLNIKYKTSGGKNELVHTLNGTAAAMSRIPIALIENHQDKAGKVKVPTSLRQFMGGKEVL